MVYDSEPNVCQCFRVDIKKRKVVQNGPSFELLMSDFVCMSLDGDVVTGVSATSEFVNKFDVRQRKMVAKIRLHGAYLDIQCICDASYKSNVSFKFAIHFK
jgi:hypothetical protein